MLIENVNRDAKLEWFPPLTTRFVHNDKTLNVPGPEGFTKLISNELLT